MVNGFIKERIKSKLKNSNSKYKSYIIKEAYMMNEYGVKDEKSLLRFHYISQYVPIFVKNIYGEYNKKLMSKVFGFVMSNSELINCSNDIKDKVAEYFSKSSFIKNAYPNYGNELTPKKYNLNKWESALNDITIRAKLYGDKLEATEYVTKNWSDMDEKNDFKNWAKNKEQGIGKLYRIALFGDGIVPD